MVDTAAIAAHAEDSLSRLQKQTGGEVHDGVIGTFARERVYQEAASADAGEPVYTYQDVCYITVPGNARANVKHIVREYRGGLDAEPVVVDDIQMRRFPRAWEAFLKGEDLRPDGTPLEECSKLPPSRLAALRAVQIRTVEQLAELPDASLRTIGGDGRALRQIARDYMSEHGRQERLEREVEELKAKLAEVTNDGDGNSDAPRRRGRPRNQPTE